MREPVVHIALEGDVVAVCDAPIDVGTPRAQDPEQATCGECVEACVEGWEAARETPDGIVRPPGTPPRSAEQPAGDLRAPSLLLAFGGVLALVATLVALLVTGGGNG
ncbi:hypothetical protein [Streptomyces fragilis]|uniref:Uncharacterized protein n=1 Tax=Streptomyces fragilis TaxID=67301 RepID=A0ABV2YDL0_9ACTN|nr:hypothetical protein [Streptomyces fragilis]